MVGCVADHVHGLGGVLVPYEDVGVHADAGGEDDRVAGPFRLGHGPAGREPGVALIGSLQQQGQAQALRTFHTTSAGHFSAQSRSRASLK